MSHKIKSTNRVLLNINMRFELVWFFETTHNLKHVDFVLLFNCNDQQITPNKLKVDKHKVQLLTINFNYKICNN